LNSSLTLGQLVVLEGDEEFPTILAAQGEDGSIGEQAVEDKHEGETRKAGFEALGQAVKGLEFAVLFGDVLPGVLDELAQDAEGKPVGAHELGLEHVMVIEGFAVVRLGQAIRAMALGIDQRAGPVHGNEEIAPQEPVGIQHLGIDQDFDQAGHAFLDLLHIEAAHYVVHGVAVRNAAIKQRMEQGMARWTPQQPIHLPPRPQPAQEHPDARPHNSGQRIVNIAGAADPPRVGHAF